MKGGTMARRGSLASLAIHLEPTIKHIHLTAPATLRSYVAGAIAFVWGERSRRTKKLLRNLDRVNDQRLPGWVTELYLKGVGMRTTGELRMRKIGRRKKYVQVRI